MISKLKIYAHIQLLKKFGIINRITLSSNYIKGEGIEIGAMNLPLPIKKGVKVKYLDRCSKEESERLFPELENHLVDVEIIGDGETLANIPNESNDFIIGNHFIEHCQNPIFTIENMLRVIRPGGIVFMAIPDMRYTFDCDRALTTIDHFIKDYEMGPEWSEADHYFDFVKNTDHGTGKSDAEIIEIGQQLKDNNFSIHFHVWDHQSMIDMFCEMKKRLGFKFEIQAAIAAEEGNNESVFILKKY